MKGKLSTKNEGRSEIKHLQKDEDQENTPTHFQVLASKDACD